jgi:streptogramin lyase
VRRLATILVAAAALAVALVAAIDAIRGDRSDGAEAETSETVVDAEGDGSAADLPASIAVELSRPGGIAVAGGLVWVASEGTLVHVDPSDTSLRGQLDLDARPGDVIDGDGAVYVTDEATGDAIRVEVPAQAVAGRLTTVVPVVDIAFADGDAWVPDPAHSAVLRIDPATGTVRARISVPSPASVTAGAGAVWALSPQARLVSRIDPASNLVAPIRLDDVPGQVAVAGGAVWVSHPTAGAISRIDPARDAVAARVEVGSDPLLIAADGRGLWVLGIDRLSWLDAGTSRVAGVARLELTRPPGPQPIVVGLAAGEGAAWVADTYGDAVIRVAAPT